MSPGAMAVWTDADLVDPEAEDVGGGGDGLLVLDRHRPEHGGVDADLLGLLAHAHEVGEHRPSRYAAAVDQFLHDDPVDPRGQGREHGGQALEHEARVLAGGVEPGAGGSAGGLDARGDLGAEGGEVVVGRGGDDVLARLEQVHDVVGVGVARVGLAGRVQHDVGDEPA
jgi:hypothetical protein